MSLDFLKGPRNYNIDIMRVGAAFVIFIAYPFPFAWSVIQHGAIPDPAAYGVGWGSVFIAAGGAIFAKDVGVAKANATTTTTTTTAEVSDS